MLSALALGLSAPPGTVFAATATTSPCTIFPADNVWHAPATHLPVDGHSAAYVRSIGLSAHLHPDFGSGLIDGEPFGFPVTGPTTSAAAVRISFTYADESDRGPYRIPPTAAIENGPQSTGDRHVLVWDHSTCTSYELWNATRHSDGSWTAGSGAIFNLRSDALRPAGWTSADAAGLSILAGLVTYGQVASGRINHAIRITVPRTDARYLWPARHEASYTHSSLLPPMGQRLRLKASIDISHLPYQARVIAQALKTYGAIVADNGSAWYISGTQDQRWNNTQLDALKAFTGADFEAVSQTPLEIYPNSGRARTI